MSRGNEAATVARVAAFLRSGELARAERTGRAVLKRDPRNPDAWHLHAMAALEAGNLAKARSRLERAIAIRADNSVFHSNLGAVLERLGDLEGSYRAHDRALALDRGPADNWFNHGLILLRLGRPAEAASSLRAARDRAAGDPEIRLNLGRALERTGDGEGALGEYRSALARAAGSGGERWAGEITGALRRILGVVFPVEAAPDVRRFLVETGVAPDLGPAAAAQLRIGAPSPQDETAVARFLAENSGDRLFLDYLRGGVNLDPELERLLAAGRAHRLREWTAAGEVEAVARAAGPEGRLAAALAIQCFHNEYAWYVSEEEKALLAAPAARLDRALAGDGTLDPLPDPLPDPKSLTADLLLVSLYRPANALPGAERLAAVAPDEWDPPVAELLRHSLYGPREELGIARELPALAAVRDRISRAVQAQYEENPYPRWISLPPGPDLDLGETLARRFPDRPARGPVETVLVAGGGTGYEPLLAARQNSRAQVLSLDLSRASLAYGARMARRLGMDNLRFVQGDLLDVETLGERFDIVLASGVLHHMADPEAGLRVLARVLRPGGIIKIGLYSEYARDLVAKARDAAARGGRDGSPEGIRAFRREIVEGGRPELRRLLQSADFYTVSSCRDLVFHVHERRFTIPGVAGMLAAAGLRPLGFEAGREVGSRYRRRFPGDPHLRSLESLAEFEKDHTEAFAGMYVLWAEHGRIE